ncbi:nuclear transport factor 2 family protein [Winogradskyella aurantiaca]|uniref:nuclear transport factor 2 family protein n=1 Tax=Winogradskyella aurantiaca TaxID=2219558 RepID=UPI000E1D2EBE|nr:nuclear transport factor 2 family protein [Winogradskyella aurantiaca]
MKKVLLVVLLLSAITSFSQKKTNGKIYIEHPALEIAKQFDDAFVKGDLETIKSLVADDFAWRNPSMRGVNGTLEQLLNRADYLSKNIIDFEIKHRGTAYPDVFEYKGDKSVDVKTYTWLTGYDKNTGVELNMPRNTNFRMTEDGKKIAWIFIMDDQLLWNKAYDAYETKRNGIIYKDHPYISKVRLLVQAYQAMDFEKAKSMYSESAQFYDVMNTGIDEFKTLDEEFAGIEDYMKTYEILDIRESGYPDVLDYEGNGAVVISWWVFTFKNKESGNSARIMQHIQHSFNENGDIIREDYYFNPAALPKSN